MSVSGCSLRIERGGDGRRRFSDADLDWLSLLTKLRATGMPVREMRRYAELVRSGAGHQERVELLRRHRDQVRRDLAAQRECLKLLDAKITYYGSCAAEALQPGLYLNGRSQHMCITRLDSRRTGVPLLKLPRIDR